jgi:membrane fusion protein (multidrug efflux system)
MSDTRKSEKKNIHPWISTAHAAARVDRKKRHFSLLRLWIAAVLLLCFGCGSGEQPKSASMPPVAVETVVVEPERVEEILTVVGTLLSNESVNIKPEVSGKIEYIGFEEGQSVDNNTVLFRLDTELLETEYGEARTNYDFAKSQYRRAEKLRKDRVIPDERYDEVYREYANAGSRLKTLSTRLKKHSIEAPFGGRLGARRVSVGDYVGVGQDLVHLEDLSTIKAEFYVPERYLSKIGIGLNVRIRVESLAQAHEGFIYFIDPRINIETRSAIVRARIPNPDETLRPGMFCTAEIIMEVETDALMVPQTAVFARGTQQFVYIRSDGTAEARPVTPGIFSGSRLQITEGLQPGETIVVSGIQKIMPGARLIDAAQAETKPLGSTKD